MFDQRSGKYIDFYIPGYYQYSDDFVSDYTKQYHPNMEVRSDKWRVTTVFTRSNETYWNS